jgi:predicted MPP superfamily phosphohydrolase
VIHSLVLRFSDVETGDEWDSIDRHNAILKDKHRVLWGWWKKELQEPLQLEVLKKVQTLCPIRIGLANTMEDEYYVACCTDIFYDPDGKNIPSPDLSCTPDYYRDSSLPAWFQFSSIKLIKGIEFAKEFGALPLGKNTLFGVDRSSSGICSLVISPLERETIETHGASILHLSDLHFGEDHGFVMEKVENPIPELPLEDIIFQGLQSNSNTHIGMVVISGDFITKGNATNYIHAQKFLENLLAHLHLGKEHVVMVPGNHDIPVEENDKKPTMSYGMEKQYISFIRSFFGKDLKETDRLHSFKTPENWQINFLALSSCRLRSKDTMDYGFIGKDRYANFLYLIKKECGNKNISELARDKVLNFAVFHHHILPVELKVRPDIKPEPRPVSLTLDAGEIVTELQDSAFHFVLHGHQHLPFIGSTSRIRRIRDASWSIDYPIIVIGIGSSGAKGDRISDEMRDNSFGVYTPKKDGLHILMYKYNKTLPPQIFQDIIVPF